MLLPLDAETRATNASGTTRRRVARVEPWSELRTRLIAQGIDLRTDEFYGPSPLPPEEDAWVDWARLAPSLGVERNTIPLWPLVEPHLEAIETALGKTADHREVGRTFEGSVALQGARNAGLALAHGAVIAEDEREALRRLDLAMRVGRVVAGSPLLLTLILSIRLFRAVIEAAGQRLEKGVSPEGNAELRRTEAKLRLPDWREVVRGELKFSVGELQHRPGRGTRHVFPSTNRLYDRLDDPAELDRAQSIGASHFAPVILRPATGDELADFVGAAKRLDIPRIWRLSPDPVKRLLAVPGSRAWSQTAHLYRGVEAWRRTFRLASALDDFPPTASFAEAVALRDSLGEAGRDPIKNAPLWLRDEGPAWQLACGDGQPTPRHLLTIRLPRRSANLRS